MHSQICANLFKMSGIPCREHQLVDKFLTATSLLQVALSLQVRTVVLVQTVYKTVNPNSKLFSFPTLFPNPPVSRNTYSLHFSWVKILYFLFLSTDCGLSHSPCSCMDSSYQQKMLFVSAWVALVPWSLKLNSLCTITISTCWSCTVQKEKCRAPHISICTWILLMNKCMFKSGQDAQKCHPLQTCNYI